MTHELSKLRKYYQHQLPLQLSLTCHVYHLTRSVSRSPSPKRAFKPDDKQKRPRRTSRSPSSDGKRARMEPKNSPPRRSRAAPHKPPAGAASPGKKRILPVSKPPRAKNASYTSSPKPPPKKSATRDSSPSPVPDTSKVTFVALFPAL